MKIVLMTIVVIALTANVSYAKKTYYNKDYLEYDKYGLKYVNCMRCNRHVKQRVVKRVEMPDGERIGVYTIRVNSNLVVMPYELNDNSYTNILLCKKCKKKMIFDDPEEIEGITKQLRRGWVLEAIGSKRSREEIKDIEKRVKKIKAVKKHKFKRGNER